MSRDLRRARLRTRSEEDRDVTDDMLCEYGRLTLHHVFRIVDADSSAIKLVPSPRANRGRFCCACNRVAGRWNLHRTITSEGTSTSVPLGPICDECMNVCKILHEVNKAYTAIEASTDADVREKHMCSIDVLLSHLPRDYPPVAQSPQRRACRSRCV